MEQFDLKKFLVENKLTTNSKALSEGFLDNIAKTLTGKSDQGAALEKEIQRLMPGFKNGGYIYTPMAPGGTKNREWEVPQYIQEGGNLDVQFPMPIYPPGMGKEDPYLYMTREKIKFNYDLEVPTVQSLGREAFNIVKQKFMPKNGEELIPNDPTEITPEAMAELKDGFNHAGQIKMVPLVEAVKNWPGRAGDYARNVLAKRQQQ